MRDHVRATWWSQAIMIGAIVGAVMLPLGALLFRLGLPLQIAFFVFLGGGLVLAAIAVIAGLIALIVALRTRRNADRPRLYVGLLLGGAVVGLMLAQILTARSVPPIHDISTDSVDPPTFDVAVGLRGDKSNPLTYDPAVLAPPTQAAYPFVKSITTMRSADQSFERARDVIQGMGLEIVNADMAGDRIEAVATSFWFGFKDDVVVRIRAYGSGSVVDVRSVSRVGVSDIGVNAKRIQEFIKRFNEGQS